MDIQSIVKPKFVKNRTPNSDSICMDFTIQYQVKSDGLEISEELSEVLPVFKFYVWGLIFQTGEISCQLNLFMKIKKGDSFVTLIAQETIELFYQGEGPILEQVHFLALDMFHRNLRAKQLSYLEITPMY